MPQVFSTFFLTSARDLASFVIRPRYSETMVHLQPLPELWLLSDARNDKILEEVLDRLPRKSGFVFRHYHLNKKNRLKRFKELKRVCRQRDHMLILADNPDIARAWGARGVYGPAERLHRQKGNLLRIMTVHNLREVGLANIQHADAIMLSPVFFTNTHKNACPLKPNKFRFLAARSMIPVIALGGMNKKTARQLEWTRWGAIEGLSSEVISV